MKKSLMLIGHPQIPGAVLCHGKNRSAGKRAQRYKAPILQIAKATKRGNPNPSMGILEHRLWDIVDVPAGAATANAINLDFAIFPSIQAAAGAEPDASVLVSQNSVDHII